MFPVHTWLPDAHTEAPTAGSVILAGVLLKMGVYGMIRFCIGFFPEVAVKAMVPVLILSAIAVIYGAAMSLVQPDMKRLVAYSSVSHMGFVTAGLFAFNQQAVEGSILQMVSHGILTGALFMMVGFFYDRTHTRLIADYGGLAKPMPMAAAFFSLFVLGSLGLPGLAGFVSEFLVLVGVFQYAKVFAVLLSVGVVLSAAYLLWMYQRTMFQGPNEKWASLKDLSVREIVTLVPLVALAFWIGLYPDTFLNLLHAPVNEIALAGGELQMKAVDLITVAPELVLLLAACVILLVEAFARPQGAAKEEKEGRGLWSAGLVIALVGLVASAAVSIWMLDGSESGFGGTLVSDTWAVFFNVLFAAGAAVAVLMSPAYLQAHGRHLGEYYALVLFAVVGMDLMAAARDLVVFYVALELMAICSYLLAAFFRYRVRSNESSLKYFVTGSFASAVTLYGISLVYGLVGSTGYEQVFVAAGATGSTVSTSGLIFAAFLIAVGLAFKVSAAPFHMWTPDVYQGAPTPIAAFFSVGPKVAGFSVLMVRLRHGVRRGQWRVGPAVHRARHSHHAGGQPLRPGADQREADAGLLVYRACRLPAHRPGRPGLDGRAPRGLRGAHLSGGLHRHEPGGLRRARPPQDRGFRQVRLLAQAAGRAGEAVSLDGGAAFAVLAVAHRHTGHRGVHRQVLRVRRRGLGRACGGWPWWACS